MLSRTDRKKIKKINSFINLNINKEKNYYWQSGYKNFGILLVGFCEWINKQNNDKDKIFFLSRDGYIVKKAYELLYPDQKTNYFYVSRKSLSLPTINNPKNIDEILDSMVLPPIFTIDTILSVFSINVGDVRNELDKANIDIKEEFKRTTFKNNKKIRKLIKLLEDKILPCVKEQKDSFMQYLEQEKFKNVVSIVDIGWHNSIQKTLIKIANDTIINGYYIGVYDNAKKIDKPNNAYGYLYTYGNDMNKQYRAFSFVSLFETIFLSHEGTTIGYKKSADKIEPILADYEYKEEQESYNLVRDFQNGAIEFVKDYKKNNLSIELNSNICSYNIIKFGSNPTKKNIDMFGKISFENYKVRNIINFNKSSIYYFIHPKVMINDFFTSGWRVAFLKKLFKIPFPYYYVIKILCIIFKKEQ